MSERTPAPFQAPVALAGEVLALISLALIGFLFAVEAFAAQKHPYMGLITYIVLPGFLILGLLLMGLGAYRSHRRAQAGIPEAPPLRIDFGNPRHRRVVIAVMVGSFLFLVVSAFGSYQAYEYTDSVDFCGRVCHYVMKPEYTAYLASPHARVACVECHIGPGADWFVRSKISGAYQVYSVLFHKYHRPIETPIHNLRPAKETCEQCHWPRLFYSAKLQGRTYYLSDEKNTPIQMNMLMKIGGGDPAHGSTEGIHYHMYIANRISYVARDPEHLDIPYVEELTKDGRTIIYRTTENPMSDAEVRKAKKQVVDCIECHNRPTHIFRNPNSSVNLAMQEGQISATLPNVKKTCVAALEQPYKTQAAAMQGIQSAIESAYRSSDPGVTQSRQADIDAAVRQTQGIYRLNYFPEMRVDWKAHPDHLDHLYSTGCFRCHDGKHVSQDGKVLSRDCNVCHTILSEKVGSAPQRVSLTGLQFEHPVDIGDSWKTMSCSDCHAQQ